jgi:hypothetical protein
VAHLVDGGDQHRRLVLISVIGGIAVGALGYFIGRRLD